MGYRTRKMEDVWTSRSVAQVCRFGWLSEVGGGAAASCEQTSKEPQAKGKTTRFPNTTGVWHTPVILACSRLTGERAKET